MFIAGLSMGGFGALYNGLISNNYGAIGAFSPAISIANNSINLYQILNESVCQSPLFISCVNKDFLYDQVLQFSAQAKEKLFVKTLFKENYQHEWRFWDMSIEWFLDSIIRNDYYKDKKRLV